MRLPENSEQHRVIMGSDRQVHRRGLVYRLLCSHKQTRLFTRIDYALATGLTYSGHVCLLCGHIVKERRIF